MAIIAGMGSPRLLVIALPLVALLHTPAAGWVVAGDFRTVPRVPRRVGRWQQMTWSAVDGRNTRKRALFDDHNETCRIWPGRVA
jgi:hypothetical protein